MNPRSDPLPSETVTPAPSPADVVARPDELVRQLLAASADCVKVLDLDGNLLSMSPTGLVAFEIDDLACYIGSAWADWWQGAQRDAVRHAVAEARAGRVARFEAPLPTAKGTPRWWDVVVSPLRNADGRTEQILSVSRDVTAQHATLDAAAERLDRLQSVIESAEDYAVISVDLDGTIDGWSNGAAATFGWPEAEAVGRPFALIWTPEDLATGNPEKELAIARQDGVAPDTRWHLHAAGHRIYVVGATRPIRNSSGTLIGYVKVCRNETDRAAAERELADTRRRLEAALAGGQIATWVWEAATDRIYPDANMTSFFHLPADDGAGLPVAAYVQTLHPDDRPAMMAALAEAIATGADFVAEYRIVTFDPPRWAYARARVERDPSGKAIRLAGVVQDVTQRKQSEADLRFERHQLALIFRESPAAMALWSGEDLRFERVNPGYQRLFGGRALVGLPIVEALPELADQPFPDMLRHVMTSGEPVVGVETLARLARTAGGPLEDRYFDFSYLQVVDADGAPWGVYDHAVEVTDRVVARQALERSQQQLRDALADREALLDAEKSARTAAEQASQMKDEFLATLSHELRTPLSAILGWSQMLRRPNLQPASIAEGLSTIERNARVQTQIIDDLLDMSRIISGKIALDAQRTNLANVVRAAIDTVRPTAAAKGVEILCHAPDDARFPILGDFNRLQQVFWNLLTNAVKFTPRGGLVQVWIEQRHSQWQVDVTDSGDGISAEFLPHVFDRFRQADASTTRRHGGLGLGLAIVKQLSELHGGQVRVRSAGAGKGSTFTVSLPLSIIHEGRVETADQRREAFAEIAAGDLAEPTPRDGIEWNASLCDDIRGKRVLVLDDEADARSMLKSLFEHCGVEVFVAATADEAIALVERERPDAFVSDIGMPGVDGYELIRRVRALGPARGGATPAIALTAYARAEDRVKAILAGFQTHVPKPVEPAELIAMVASLVNRN